MVCFVETQNEMVSRLVDEQGEERGLWFATANDEDHHIQSIEERLLQKEDDDVIWLIDNLIYVLGKKYYEEVKKKVAN